MTRLPRYTRLSRGGAIKPKKRKPSEFARIYGSKARVEWVKSLACVASSHPSCDGPIENAHTANGGMGRKADADTIVPLCRAHHRVLHAHGVGAFEILFSVDLTYRAEVTQRAWLAWTERAA